MWKSYLHYSTALLLIIVFSAQSVFAEEKKTYRVVQPPGLLPRVSSEYYSPSANAQVLIPIYIWGDIKEPGVHYVPEGATLVHAISAAGGPLPTADLPEVLLQRSPKIEKYVDLFDDGHDFKIQAKDTIFVDRSMKQDLPLIFGIVSSVVSIATLVLITAQDKDR